MWEDACEILCFPASSTCTPITSSIVTERAPSSVQMTTDTLTQCKRYANIIKFDKCTVKIIYVPLPKTLITILAYEVTITTGINRIELLSKLGPYIA